MLSWILSLFLHAPFLVCHVETTWDGAFKVKDSINELSRNHYTVCFVSDKDSVPLIKYNELQIAPAGVAYYHINYPIAFVCGGYRDACFKNFIKYLHEDNPYVILIPINGCIY